MIAPLPVAVRAFTARPKRSRRRRAKRIKAELDWRPYVLIFDTETTTDRTQRLLFGCYWFCRWTEDGARLEVLEEGLIHADDLTESNPEGLRTLVDYAKRKPGPTIKGTPEPIQLRSRRDFVERVLWRAAWKVRATVVGFNLPFDLSRIAIGAGSGRRGYFGSFTLQLWDWWDGRIGQWRDSQFRPRIVIEHLDSKRSFIRFAPPWKIDPEDKRPPGQRSPDDGYAYPGHFLDLRTLSYALSGEGHSLRSACKAFGVSIGKGETGQHGVITPDYIDYCCQDVRASAGLLEALRREFDRHPIDLDPAKAYSPASIAKAYYRAMGLSRPLEKFGVSPRILGKGMAAFYGGRAEARIIRTPIPVVYTDFRSMYPTVQALLGLWDIASAESLRVASATQEVKKLLRSVVLDQCFDPKFWVGLRGFALVEPRGDVLPVRAQYYAGEWNVGVNHLTSRHCVWFALPELVHSVLQTGRVPKVLSAIILRPAGKEAGLLPVELRGEVLVDPRRDSPFARAVEERAALQRSTDLDPQVAKALTDFLKMYSNAGSYGVFVEANPDRLRPDRPVEMSVHTDAGSHKILTSKPEDPGAFMFPPVASLITSGARLMLGLLERCVTDLGGTYAFCDTDSMAIAATSGGRLMPCRGGPYLTTDRAEAVQSLTWDQVQTIVDRFSALNPYDRGKVPGSILKIENVNFDDQGRQREVWAYAISAKRYALFTLSPTGEPLIEEKYHSKHGLGLYMNPLNPESENTDWIEQVWRGVVREALGLGSFEPAWGHKPAVIRSNVSTPEVYKRFRSPRAECGYEEQVKPFNFLMSATVSGTDRPPGTRPSDPFRLVAPYSTNPAEWTKLSWIDVHTGREYQIRTEGESGPLGIRVRTFDDVLQRFRRHPESKSADADGIEAGPDTGGLLRRRNVEVQTILHIGKEANELERGTEGVGSSDPQEFDRVDDLCQDLGYWLARVNLGDLAKLVDIEERLLRKYRSGERRPRPAQLRLVRWGIARIAAGETAQA